MTGEWPTSEVCVVKLNFIASFFSWVFMGGWRAAGNRKVRTRQFVEDYGSDKKASFRDFSHRKGRVMIV